MNDPLFNQREKVSQVVHFVGIKNTVRTKLPGTVHLEDMELC